MTWPTFWVEPTGYARRTLRIYVFAKDDECPDYKYGHNASVLLGGLWAEVRTAEGYHPVMQTFDGDTRWPTACTRCGKAFAELPSWMAHRQVNQHTMYRRRADNGDRWREEDLPPGAMWDGWWHPKSWRGADGISLTVMLPGGADWCVDSRASNCTMRETDPDFSRHKCWVRVGDPLADPPTVHVSKEGPTCAAGAGSIAAPGYHGHLVHGVLSDPL